MKHQLTAEHKEYLVKIGIPEPHPDEIDITDVEYERQRANWKRSLPHASEGTLKMRIIGHAASRIHSQRVAGVVKELKQKKSDDADNRPVTMQDLITAQAQTTIPMATQPIHVEVSLDLAPIHERLSEIASDHIEELRHNRFERRVIGIALAVILLIVMLVAVVKSKAANVSGNSPYSVLPAQHERHKLDGHMSYPFCLPLAVSRKA
jgi:hypothetical protein